MVRVCMLLCVGGAVPGGLCCAVCCASAGTDERRKRPCCPCSWCGQHHSGGGGQHAMWESGAGQAGRQCVRMCVWAGGSGGRQGRLEGQAAGKNYARGHPSLRKAPKHISPNAATPGRQGGKRARERAGKDDERRRRTFSTLKPIVGTVLSTSPMCSLYSIVVLPAASRPAGPGRGEV